MAQIQQNTLQLTENLFSTPYKTEHNWVTWRTAVSDELARRWKNGSDPTRTDRTGTFQAIRLPAVAL